MAVRIVDAPIRELYGQEVAPQDNSDATTDRRSTNVRKGFHEIIVNAVLASRLALCPKIIAMYWYNDATDTFISLLNDDEAILDSARTGAASFKLAAADFLYIGAVDRFQGARILLNDSVVNAQNQAMTAAYSNVNKSFVAVAITDGTNSTGTMAQDGNITIALAAMPDKKTWSGSTLKDLTGLASAPPGEAHWLRLGPAAALDAVELEQVASFSAHWASPALATAGGLSLKAVTEYTIDLSEDVGAIEYQAVSTGATTMQVGWIRR